MVALRIVFMGTPELACASLRALLEMAEARVVAVVTQPDQPKGRGLKLQPSPVKEIALRENLPILQPPRVRDEAFIESLRQLEPDLIAVTAYGQILPKTVLDLPRFGCINVHASLLPKYRGAAPIQWAILNGETETGVTLMKMDAGMDTGDMLAWERTPIQSRDNAQTLHDRLARMGADLLVRTIPGYICGDIRPQPQPVAGISYAPKIKKQDGHIDWSQPAPAVCNRVRAMTPWPGAYAHWTVSSLSRLLKIWEAEVVEVSGEPGRVLRTGKDGIVIGCGAAAVNVQVLQPEGGRRMSANEFLSGHNLQPGYRVE